MAVLIQKAHHSLYHDLAGIVGTNYVSDSNFTLETYSRDTSCLPPNKQGIVVRPSSVDEVVDIVRLANITKNPIVVSGGRAGYWGTPKGLPGKGIVVDMTRMKKMLKIDEMNVTATAEAGMTTAEFTTHLWDIGWDVHTAFQPWFSDTLGGQLAGFCGGGNGLEMAGVGFNATHIAGVKVVLPDGSIVQTGGGAGNNIHNDMIYDRYPGNPDLTGMFMGDAGCFGIKVEATYRMYKYSPERAALAYYFETYEKAYDCILEMSTVEPLPYYLIVIITPTEFVKSMGLTDYCVITIAKGWTKKECDAKVEILEDIYAKHNGRLAEGDQVEDWKNSSIDGRRHREMGEFGTLGIWHLFEYFAARSQVVECYHTMRDFIYGRLKKMGIDYKSNEGTIPSAATSFIVSLIVFVEGNDPNARQALGRLFAEATEMATSHGWYPDCHQGLGTRMMAKYWPKERFEFMKKLKTAVDPNNIMNPGIWDL